MLKICFHKSTCFQVKIIDIVELMFRQENLLCTDQNNLFKCLFIKHCFFKIKRIFRILRLIISTVFIIFNYTIVNYFEFFLNCIVKTTKIYSINFLIKIKVLLLMLPNAFVPYTKALLCNFIIRIFSTKLILTILLWLKLLSIPLVFAIHIPGYLDWVRRLIV